MADEQTIILPEAGGALSVTEQWQQLASTIPVASDQDALDSIAEQVFNAATPEELMAPWALSAKEFGALLNVPVRITALRKSKSDYESGPGFFLVLDLVELVDGEKLVVTTGAVSVMAQLIKAYSAGWLPLTCVLRQADRPSSAGYFPQHLEVTGAKA